MGVSHCNCLKTSQIEVINYYKKRNYFMKIRFIKHKIRLKRKKDYIDRLNRISIFFFVENGGRGAFKMFRLYFLL